jgi:hypothetical protein
VELRLVVILGIFHYMFSSSDHKIIHDFLPSLSLQGAVRTRRSDNSQQDLKLGSVLSFFSTTTSAKAIVKKMGTEVAQHLLAHAYQVRDLKGFYFSS